MEKELISLVIPVYGDKRLVKLLYYKLKENLSKIGNTDYEIIMVNDACPYGSGEEIANLAASDTKVKFIDLSRNFGQHMAIKAGLDHANGDWAVVMDCDLQDNPEDIVRFYEKAKNENYDVVFGERTQREDLLLRKIFTSLFKFVSRKLTKIYYEKNIGNFSIISKKIIKNLSIYKNSSFEYASAICYMGFNTGYIEIKKNKRIIGSSSYNIFNSMKLMVDSIIINSRRSLTFVTYISFLMFLVSFIFILELIYDHYNSSQSILVCNNLMIALFLMLGILFFCSGILGIYLLHLLQNSKNRPLYFIKKKINL